MHTYSFTPFPVITTQRTTLRQMKVSDANAIFALRSSYEIGKYINRPLQQTIEDAMGYIERINAGILKNEWIFWAISLHGNPDLIGTICLWNFSVDANSAEVGYELLPAYQGKGLMNEALKQVLAFAFNAMGVNMVDAYTHRQNSPSIRLLEKNNFVPAVNRTDVQTPANIIYELTADRYAK